MSKTLNQNVVGGSSSRVKVAIRVRPLCDEELQKGCRCIVESASENGLIVLDPSSFYASTKPEFAAMDPNCWTRNFAFDHCLWSINKSASNYASQAEVFETVGQPVVQWALDGFNTCVFAYGQTGAGKSYTMIGSHDNPSEFGLIPRICFGLFNFFEQSNEHSHINFSVEFSFLEIYNEALRDCLSSTNSSNIKMREHPHEGIYVANLTTVKVNSFEDILSLINIGNKTRCVASTKSNAQSSRSHAIVTLTVRQRFDNSFQGGAMLKHKISKINLVDLAGSERVIVSGSVGQRLKEANNINKSLSVLGDVIKCLGNTKRREGHIPYRNSALTMVLKNSLGGNSQTIMVATISPSSNDYDETISTLKYADNAKKVRMQVAMNVVSGLLENDHEAKQLVPVLQAEVSKLRELLHKQQEVNRRNSISPPLELVEEMRNRVMELEQQLADREELINHLQRQSFDRSHSQSHQAQGQGQGQGRDVRIQYNDEEAFVEDAVDGRIVDNLDDDVVNPNTIDDVETKGKDKDVPNGGKNNKKLFNGEKQLSDNILKSQNKNKLSTSSVSSLSDDGVGNQLSNVSIANSKQTRCQPLVVLADEAHDTSLPRVINLNQDPLFSECLVYYIPVGIAVAGSSELDVDILLTGPDILQKHCILVNEESRVWITPAHQGAKVYVNGDLLVYDRSLLDILKHKSVRNHSNQRDNEIHRVYLRHFDRIAMGKYHLFRFEEKGKSRAISPSKSSSSKNIDRNPSHQFAGDAPGWDFAHDELMMKNSLESVNKYTSRKNSQDNDKRTLPYSEALYKVTDGDKEQESLSHSSGGRRVAYRRYNDDDEEDDEDYEHGVEMQAEQNVRYGYGDNRLGLLDERDSDKNRYNTHIHTSNIVKGSTSRQIRESTLRSAVNSLVDNIVSYDKNNANRSTSNKLNTNNERNDMQSKSDSKSRGDFIVSSSVDYSVPAPPPSAMSQDISQHSYSSRTNQISDTTILPYRNARHTDTSSFSGTVHANNKFATEIDDNFAKEANSLQADLIEMQRNLQMKMKKYNTGGVNSISMTKSPNKVK